MIVLSLFDGMTCGKLALEAIGMKPKVYYASEVDKFAIAESKANHPDVKHLGCVTKWREWGINWSSVDLLIGGSPCQGFSLTGKRLAFDDPRSALFFVYVDILNHIKRVNRKIKFMLENVKMKKDHLSIITEYLGVKPIFINSELVSAQKRQRYYWCNWNVEQPSDRGIMLRDILECEGVGLLRRDGKWRIKNDKSHCILANYHKGLDNKAQRTVVLEMKPRGKFKGGQITLDGKAPTMTACSWQENFKLTDGNGKYRKLTVVECCRLQGVPDDYFKISSNTQAYKMLGNGWQVCTVKHIFKALRSELLGLTAWI